MVLLFRSLVSEIAHDVFSLFRWVTVAFALVTTD
jgi:hypothetical protein